MKYFLISLVILSSILKNGLAQVNPKLFQDSIDKAFDMSKWLFELHGFMPILVPITEPAIGYGAVGAGV